MRQTCVYGIAIAAALGFAPPANAGVVNVPTMRPSLPKVIPQTPKVTPQTLKVSGAKVGTKVGPHQGHHTPQTPTVASQTPTVTPQTKVTPQPPKGTSQTPTVTPQSPTVTTVPVTVTPTGSLQTPTANLQTPSVALQPPTTVTPPINLQRTPDSATSIFFNSDSTVYSTEQPTVTLHPNGPPTVSTQIINTTTPTGSAPQIDTQQTNTGFTGLTK